MDGDRRRCGYRCWSGSDANGTFIVGVGTNFDPVPTLEASSVGVESRFGGLPAIIVVWRRQRFILWSGADAE